MACGKGGSVPALELPKFVDNVLHQEVQLPSLLCRFQVITVQTFLKMNELPIRRLETIFYFPACITYVLEFIGLDIIYLR